MKEHCVWVSNTFKISYKIVALFTENYPSKKWHEKMIKKLKKHEYSVYQISQELQITFRTENAINL